MAGKKSEPVGSRRSGSWWEQWMEDRNAARGTPWDGMQDPNMGDALQTPVLGNLRTSTALAEAAQPNTGTGAQGVALANQAMGNMSPWGGQATPLSNVPGTATTLGQNGVNANGAPIYGANELSPSFAYNNPAAAAAQVLARAGGTTNLENPWTQMVMKYAEGIPFLAEMNGGVNNILPFMSDYIGAMRQPMDWNGTPGANSALYSLAEVQDVFRNAAAGTLAGGAQSMMSSQDWGTMANTLTNFLQTVAPTALSPYMLDAIMKDFQQKALDYQQYIGFGSDGATPAGAWDFLLNSGFLQRWGLM